MAANGHRGGCLCGAIRYETVPHDGNAYLCNCHFCQRMTGGPFLVEHCFTKDQVTILSGRPRVYTHVSAGSGKEVYVHFCGDCGSDLFLTLERWPETLNIVTTTLDDPGKVGFDPERLRILFLKAAQSGTLTPRGYRAYDGHCEPADGSPPVEHRFDHHVLNDAQTKAKGPHTGGCLCGDVRYAFDGAPEFTVVCHCRSCQKTLGSGVNHELLVDPAAFRVTAGTPRSFRHAGGSGKSVTRRFCGRCGSALWLTGDRFDEVGVFRGTLDQPNRVTLTADTAMQIFLDEALPIGMVMAGIDAYGQHRRAPDGSIRAATVYDHPWRVGEGP